MSLKIKQKAEQNRLVFRIAVAIFGTMFLFDIASYLNAHQVKQLVHFAIVAVILVINFFSYKKSNENNHYEHIACFSIYAAYVATLATALIYESYIYVYPIMILICIFGEKRLALRGAILGVTTHIIYSVLFYVIYQQTAIESIILGTYGVIISAITAFVFVSLSDKQNKERIDEVEEKAAEQKKIFDLILAHANELADKFNVANECSEDLTSNMESSHMSISEIAESTKVTAEAVEQQTAQTIGIQTNIQDVENEARSMANVSENTLQAVKEGVEVINELKSEAIEVAKINKESAEITRRLKESIGEVEAITETILGISSQTNLLALNASIEAARAGEHGKGFAVVADEIRSLSESTKVATEQISEIITKLTGDAQYAADSMAKSAEYSQQQNKMINEASEKLLNIEENSNALNENVRNVNVSVQEVLEANETISDSISNLSAMSQEVAASTDNSISISDACVNKLEEMNGVLSDIYRISNEMKEVSNK